MIRSTIKSINQLIRSDKSVRIDNLEVIGWKSAVKVLKTEIKEDFKKLWREIEDWEKVVHDLSTCKESAEEAVDFLKEDWTENQEG